MRSIVACGFGNKDESNVSDPLHAPSSHGLSIKTQPSGMRAFENRLMSSMRSASPLTLSRHLITSNCDCGGIGGRPTAER